MLLQWTDGWWQALLPWAMAAAAGLLLFLPALAVGLDTGRGGFAFSVLAGLLAAAAIWAFGWALLPFGLSAVFMLVTAQVMLRRAGRFFDGLMYTCGAALFGMAAGMVGLYILWGQDVLGVMADALSGYLLRFSGAPLAEQLVRDTYLAVRIAAEGITNAQALEEAARAVAAMEYSAVVEEIMPALRGAIKWSVPSAMVTWSVYAGVVGWVVPARRISRRVERALPVPEKLRRLPPMPPFGSWAIPRWLYMPMMLLMVFALAVRLFEWDTMYVASLVLTNLLYTIVMFQGMAMVWFWLGTRRVDPAVRVLIIGVVFVLARAILSWIGLLDMLFNIRRYWVLRSQLLAQLRAERPPRPDDTDRQDKDKEDGEK